MSGRLADYIGALHNFESPTVEEAWQPEERPIPRRIYPCTRDEQAPVNLSFERYKTFIIVIDKPDFVEGAGVLFLLADGGESKVTPGEHHEPAGYREVEVWRSAGMTEVARRLAIDVTFIPPVEH